MKRSTNNNTDIFSTWRQMWSVNKLCYRYVIINCLSGKEKCSPTFHHSQVKLRLKGEHLKTTFHSLEESKGKHGFRVVVCVM